ncbi:hypothetical protein KSP40_PGU006992 [Platanthera guangdongensis]|uniref:Uncharacterized protein n=1 Tax=Platanthera guangdongensis TaxID=2320717 RepID=A0ABR2LNJ5_9ASPA
MIFAWCFQQVDDLVNGANAVEGDDSRVSESEYNADPVPPNFKYGVDPFKNEEGEPLKSNAMRGSSDPVPRNSCISSIMGVGHLHCRWFERLPLMRSSGGYATVGGSSLWEIDSLRHHYCPAVSRCVTSLESDLTVKAKTFEMSVSDFSSGSYTTIFKDEVRRRINQCPLAFYRETPTSLFGESDFPGWSFEGGQIGVEETGKGDETNSKRRRIECC